MSYTTELRSWFAPTALSLESAPTPGSKAPSTDKLQFPRPGGKPVVVAFLRHCGCPFAEKTLLVLRDAAKEDKRTEFIAVSHSASSSTQTWLEAIPGGAGDVTVLVDDERTTYAKWGLGVAGWTHVLDRGVFSELFRLGREENIKNRPTETGSRWQTGGAWAVDATGTVTWGGPAEKSSEIPDVKAAVASLKK